MWGNKSFLAAQTSIAARKVTNYAGCLAVGIVGIAQTMISNLSRIVGGVRILSVCSKAAHTQNTVLYNFWIDTMDKNWAGVYW
jgi:hypothetical protein